MPLQFGVIAQDGEARAGILRTAHGEVQTPTITTNFTPALLRSGLGAAEIQKLGVAMILVNTLHTMMQHNMRPFDVREELSWSGPIMADSGGFQMVSLGRNIKVMADGIKFRIRPNYQLTEKQKTPPSLPLSRGGEEGLGIEHKITPQDILEWQNKLDVDIMMPLDRVWHLRQKNPLAYFLSVLTTEKWFKQSRGIADDNVFYIIQGGLNKLARKISINYANKWLDKGAPGIAIGGLAFGEPRLSMYNMVAYCLRRLPDNKPKHLLGVGDPIDLLECIERGVDIFDCVAHTREARHGRILTKGGYLHLKNSRYADDTNVLEDGCDCPTCQAGITRARLRANLKSVDIVQKRFAQIQLMNHNIRFLMRLMEQSRVAIRQGRFASFKQGFIDGFNEQDKPIV